MHRAQRPQRREVLNIPFGTEEMDDDGDYGKD
jgi:hypothetical protein